MTGSVCYFKAKSSNQTKSQSPTRRINPACKDVSLRAVAYVG
uniref:Uncharacterized protein n=1 Tax=Anguilla anguilla TaxID=7936 RepID=A0A0E9QI86_ANGAN